ARRRDGRRYFIGGAGQRLGRRDDERAAGIERLGADAVMEEKIACQALSEGELRGAGHSEAPRWVASEWLPSVSPASGAAPRDQTRTSRRRSASSAIAPSQARRHCSNPSSV